MAGTTLPPELLTHPTRGRTKGQAAMPFLCESTPALRPDSERKPSGPQGLLSEGLARDPPPDCRSADAVALSDGLDRLAKQD